MKNPTPLSTVLHHCAFAGILFAGVSNFGIAQNTGLGRVAVGPAARFPNNQQLPYALPRGLAAQAAAQSAIGQTWSAPAPAIPQATDATFIEFDVPGSACKASFPRCTTPTAINASGVVTGYYADANASLHGFVRSRNGSFELFDGTGATCPMYFSVCTLPSGINSQGSVTGYYCDAVTCHGFVRSPDGTITSFDPPGSLLTFANSINSNDTIVGSWYDSNFVAHGFLRTKADAYTNFDAPGAVNGTVSTALAQSGWITGTYVDVSGQSHGFLRTPDGTIETFDPAGSIYTSPASINAEGTITGTYQDATLVLHGFVRSGEGTVNTFDLSSFQTLPTSINAEGTITGNYQQGTTGLHGFIRDGNAAVTAFDPPGSNVSSAYTFANGINAAGAITGWYIDQAFLGHGFIRLPHGRWDDDEFQ